MELAGIEPLLKILHRLTQHERFAARINAHIIACGIDAFDAVDLNAENLTLIFYVDQFLKAIGERGIVAINKFLMRFGGVFGECLFKPLGLFTAFAFGQPLTDTVKRIGQPLWFNRLHQIIGCLRFKGANRMVAIGCHEYEQRRLHLNQARDN